MHKYCYEVKLFAVVRIQAKNRSLAEKALVEALGAADIDSIVGHTHDKAKITEASVFVDDVDFPYLVEYDGVEVEDLEDQPE